MSEITTLSIQNISEMKQLGIRLAGLLRKGSIITFSGGLGTGKTVLARSIIQAISPEQTDIQSPSFPILITYPAEKLGCEIWHMDCYRLKDVSEGMNLGIEEAFGQQILLIEWPDVIQDILPAERLDIHISYAREADTGEERVIKARGEAHLLQAFIFEG